MKKSLRTPRLYGPLTAFPSLITDAHSSPPTAFCRHLLQIFPQIIQPSQCRFSRFPTSLRFFSYSFHSYFVSSSFQ